MNIQQDKRNEFLLKLNLPDNVFQMLFGTKVSDEIKEYIEEPNYFYAQGWPDNPGLSPGLTDKDLLPLWENNGLIFAVDTLNEKNDYIQFYSEYPSEYEVLGKTIYCALLAVIEREFDGGAIDEELYELIKLFNMPDPEELFQLLTSGDSLDDYKQNLARA